MPGPRLDCCRTTPTPTDEAAALISGDSPNTLTEGTDGLLYVAPPTWTPVDVTPETGITATDVDVRTDGHIVIISGQLSSPNNISTGSPLLDGLIPPAAPQPRAVQRAYDTDNPGLIDTQVFAIVGTQLVVDADFGLNLVGPWAATIDMTYAIT